ncbi:hypothetical protein ACFO5R_11035 [Halosolutus amylolyticus]|uniref:Uncharacterized protein n=1 Tax=Halosolutus amylolyticus TaxID=2932267 RepID=A0ABD5PPS0_9EURY|nr:hypothetical protein [Halosolutus amylolyticus]
MSTARAVAFATDATLADAPPAVGRHVRRRVLDTLAAIVAGFRTPSIDVTMAYARDRPDREGGDTLRRDGNAPLT